ncbi:hypothetical protein [Clostridium manihotivorum]|uniref:Uncharacterized protein n=1 Tax=Clostridium manihotivorum TaxID=2320868 RepID=A0A3R5X5G0_9CLOT|nr:hypothetical protein [Clostridium manihotivorum]QAA35175.1 hypothetical protein C1I91_27965 [Clostridium manihotivorum]
MENNFYSNDEMMVDKNLQPMTLGNWVVTMILLAIPVVNLVLLFVWGFGTNVNKSKKTYCQANLIFIAIVFVLAIVASLALAGQAAKTI